MIQEYFAIVVIYRGVHSTKTAYTKHIFNNEIEAIDKCQKFQFKKIFRLQWGVEPITEEDKNRVENGETVYL